MVKVLFLYVSPCLTLWSDFWDQNVSVEASREAVGPLLWEQKLLHWNCPFHCQHILWEQGHFSGNSECLWPVFSGTKVFPQNWLISSCRLFELSCSSCLEIVPLQKNLWVFLSYQLPECFEGILTIGTLDDFIFKNWIILGISLVVQWLRLCTPNAGGLGLTPGQETHSHMPQLRVCMPHLKIMHACCNWDLVQPSK